MCAEVLDVRARLILFDPPLSIFITGGMPLSKSRLLYFVFLIRETRCAVSVFRDFHSSFPHEPYIFSSFFDAACFVLMWESGYVGVAWS